tara:strand:+ start:1641 stop:2123 length:483 start_codon:yes stop_codon:yes gene_type:complete
LIPITNLPGRKNNPGDRYLKKGIDIMFNYHGEIRPIDNEGQLGKHVRGWINEQLAEGSSVESTVNNLLEYGCISGMVCHLITYVDTTAFYNEYRGDIYALLAETLESTGLSVGELFGDKWDESDPLANDTQNQNLLAWFGFEETARRIEAQVEEWKHEND